MEAKKSAVTLVSLRDSGEELREAAEDKEELERIRNVWKPDAVHHTPEMDVLRAPTFKIDDTPPIDMLDNELEWRGFVRNLATIAANIHKLRQTWRGHEDKNIRNCAERGFFPCCRVTLGEITKSGSTEEVGYDFAKVFRAELAQRRAQAQRGMLHVPGRARHRRSCFA